MNNTEEFKQWMNAETKVDEPGINRLIEKRIHTLRRNRRLRRIALPLTTFLSIFLMFIALVNFEDSFYIYANESPFLKTWVQLVNGRQDILRAFDSKYVQKIEKTLIAGEYELIIDSMISDSRYINLFYKVKYQGKYMDFDKNEFNSNIGFEKPNGDHMTLGYQLGSYKEFWWREIFLDGDNTYDGFRMTFKPYGDESNVSSSLFISIDTTKIVKTVRRELGKKIQIAGQEVILDRLEIGAFQSRLIYHNNEKNEQLIQQLTFENSKGAKLESQKDIDDGYEFSDFEVGQINPSSRFDLKIIHVTVLKKKFTTIIFDPKTQKFTELPDFLTLIQVDKNGNNYTIALKNSTGSGTFLYPVSQNAIDLGDKWTSFIGESWMSFSITDDRPVEFTVGGGRLVEGLPIKIPLNLKEIITQK